MGNLTKQKYYNLLSHALFFWYPGYADNGNGTAMDAARFGVPTLSNDYPAMRCLNEFAHLSMKFMDGFSITKSAVALQNMQENAQLWADQLPSAEELSLATIDHTWRDVYQTVKQIVGW